MLLEGWKRVPLGEIAQITSGGTPDRAQPAYWGGNIPWVTTGEIQFNTITDTVEKITEAGLKNSAAKIFPVGTLLMAMYGQGKTRGQVAKLGIAATTNQNSAAILLAHEQHPDYYFHFLSWKYENIRDFGNSCGVSHLNGGLLKQISVPCAPYFEQKSISAILATWDAAITTTEKLLANSRRQKQALMRQMLTGKRRLQKFVVSNERLTTRFSSIPADWRHVPIERVAQEFSAKNAADRQLPVLSCTKYGGLVDSLSYFNKQVFSQDVSTYKLVERGCFAYATNHIDEGSIGYQNLYDEALISPMYTVFKLGNEIDHGFLFKLLKTEHYRQIFAANTNASVDRRGSLRWGDFKKIEIPLPSLAEQVAISGIIDSAQLEIESLQKQFDRLKDEKRALMQQLLTGKRRVRLPTPEAASA